MDDEDRGTAAARVFAVPELLEIILLYVVDYKAPSGGDSVGDDADDPVEDDDDDLSDEDGEDSVDQDDEDVSDEGNEDSMEEDEEDLSDEDEDEDEEDSTSDDGAEGEEEDQSNDGEDDPGQGASTDRIDQMRTLFRLQRVDKTFRNLIINSPKLRTIMYLKHQDSTWGKRSRLNPIFSLFGQYDPEEYPLSDDEEDTSDMQEVVLDPAELISWADGSWRDTFVVNNSATVLRMRMCTSYFMKICADFLEEECTLGELADDLRAGAEWAQQLGKLRYGEDHRLRDRDAGFLLHLHFV